MLTLVYRLEEQVENYEIEKGMLNDQVLNAVDRFLSHKDLIQTILSDVEEESNSYLRRVRESLRTM